MSETADNVETLQRLLGDKWDLEAYADGPVVSDPNGDVFSALFDLQEIQRIQDAFANATGVASIITTAKGVPITEASNFCCLCEQIIRKTERGLKNCIESDAVIGRHNPEGPIVQPCLSGRLWDAGASITVGRIHIANWLIGQVRDQNTDTAKMRVYAREIGADVESFMRAFNDVTEMPLEQFEAVAKALFLFANQMSKRAFQNLKQAHLLTQLARLNQIINRSPIVVFHWKNEKNWPVVFVSDNVVDLTEYTADDFKTRKLLYSQVIHPDDLARVEAEMKRDTSDPSVSEIVHESYRIVTKSGKTKWVQDKTRLLRDGDGVCYEAEGIVVDTTEEHEHESERREMHQKLERAERLELVGTIAGGVAHDLNNVLSAISVYPDLLLRSTPEAHPMRNSLLTIKTASIRAAEIVGDLLALSRRAVVAKEIISVRDLVREFVDSPECADLRRTYPQTKICLDLQQPLLNMKGSITHLQKCLLNLVMNAFESIDPSRDGIIEISVSNVYVDTVIENPDGDVNEGDYIELRVSDNGIGIRTEDRDRIFEPFYTTKQMGKSGTGLGMAVVWGTVKDHHGYINIDTALGKGTTFRIYLPGTRDAIRDEQRVGIEQYMGNGETVLVVDDVDMQRTVTRSILERLNYRVTTVSSGEEAVAYLQDKSVEILILDMIMEPGIDGLETYKRVLEISPRQRAIIASGYSETHKVKEAIRLGAGKYLKKPYTIENIGLAVKEELVKGAEEHWNEKRR
jgi:PAS domain S-box-containing protein